MLFPAFAKHFSHTFLNFIHSDCVLRSWIIVWPHKCVVIPERRLLSSSGKVAVRCCCTRMTTFMILHNRKTHHKGIDCCRIVPSLSLSLARVSIILARSVGPTVCTVNNWIIDRDELKHENQFIPRRNQTHTNASAERTVPGVRWHARQSWLKCWSGLAYVEMPNHWKRSHLNESTSLVKQCSIHLLHKQIPAIRPIHWS